MSAEASPGELLKVVTLLGAAVVAVPIFRRIGLGSVLGYLAAGLAIGPFGAKFFTDSHAILHVAELGVVMFLFVIGLEMRPSHLWSMRRDIFGLGSLQIAACTMLLTPVGMLMGYSATVAFIGAAGFVLTSTAIVMQLLAERATIALPAGQKIVAVLLFEDLLIVPLLAIVAILGSSSGDHASGSGWLTVGIGVGSITLLIVCGVWLLNPLFHLLARSQAREVMTAAALFVVLGAALLMQSSGLSMAMGAFLAGVLLAESSYRHQIEADIEPFRGILLGLFFMGVGMSLDLLVVANNWLLIFVGVIAMMLVKAICIYAVARFAKSTHAEALNRAVLMAQGGEFAFVLYATATAAGVIDQTVNANFTAIVVLSMAFTPLVELVYRKVVPVAEVSHDGVEEADGLTGSVLLIGFGRFGQVISQLLLLRDVDVTIIDSDPEMIRSASKFGFKIYFGDGTRLDVLRASGAQNARAIAVCIDKRESATRVAELVKSEFPQAKLLVRAFDRTHARELIKQGVDFQMREMLESAILFGEQTLREIGVEEEDVKMISKEIRQRDNRRLELEVAGDLAGGRAVMLGNIRQNQTPLVEPKRDSLVLSDDTAKAVQ